MPTSKLKIEEGWAQQLFLHPETNKQPSQSQQVESHNKGLSAVWYIYQKFSPLLSNLDVHSQQDRAKEQTKCCLIVAPFITHLPCLASSFLLMMVYHVSCYKYYSASLFCHLCAMVYWLLLEWVYCTTILSSTGLKENPHYNASICHFVSSSVQNNISLCPNNNTHSNWNLLCSYELQRA